MKESLRELTEELFPEAKVVVDHLHVTADSNRRTDEARKIEQDILRRKRIKIPKKIFLAGEEKMNEEQKGRIAELLISYPSPRGFYWAKEKIRELYRQDSREEAARLLDLIILNLEPDDDGEPIRWGNTLRRWRNSISSYFDKGTTNVFTEGCNTKIKMPKRVSYGLRNVQVFG